MFMGKKIRLSENQLIEMIQDILSEQSFGGDLRGLSPEELSKKRKMEYFGNIFFPRFTEIKDIHGMDFTIELLEALADSLRDSQ